MPSNVQYREHNFFPESFGKSCSQVVDKYFNACLHLAGFEYATNAIIIANELGIQTGFGKLCLQKQILH